MSAAVGSVEWCDEHAIRIITDTEIGVLRKLHMLFLYSFLNPVETFQSFVYLERASLLCAMFDDIGSDVIDQVFDAAYADAAAGKA